MELAKSFEPADIERRWYPEWEARGYFDAGLDTQKKNAFCILLCHLQRLFHLEILS